MILVSEAHILNEQTASPLKILMKISQTCSIPIEKLLIIFNGFVHVLRLALKPPAAFLKPDVTILFTKRNEKSVCFLSL